MSNFNAITLIAEASLFVQLVILFLFCASIVVWLITFVKYKQVKQMQKATIDFESAFWQSNNLSELYKSISEKPDVSDIGLERIFVEGYDEYSQLVRREKFSTHVELLAKHVRKKMQIQLTHSMSHLEASVGLLATIGSSAPYIGLLGTVWGIMNSFNELGQVKHATLTLIAPGISEALIATAMGLFVAIPAVIFYNRLNERLDLINQRLELFIEEFTTLLEKQLHSRTEQ